VKQAKRAAILQNILLISHPYRETAKYGTFCENISRIEELGTRVFDDLVDFCFTKQ
jgi:hypothetical protein